MRRAFARKAQGLLGAFFSYKKIQHTLNPAFGPVGVPRRQSLLQGFALLLEEFFKYSLYFSEIFDFLFGKGQIRKSGTRSWTSCFFKYFLPQQVEIHL